MTASYAIGLGARRGVSATDLVDLVRCVADDLGVALSQTALFTSESKSTEAGFHDAARQLGLSLTFLPLDALKERRSATKTHSPRVQAMFGVGSVSEAAALASAVSAVGAPKELSQSVVLCCALRSVPGSASSGERRAPIDSMGGS